jgi:hypothetical protein
MRAKESKAAVIEKVAEMAVQLGGKHLADYGAARSARTSPSANSWPA